MNRNRGEKQSKGGDQCLLSWSVFVRNNDLIHRSAWKWNSRNFRFTAF
jgi:hypothetical protein